MRTSFLLGAAGSLIATALFGCSGSGDAGSGGAGAGAGMGGAGGDLFESTAAGGSGAAECKNVDILFVVDDSGSMDDNQKSLISSFPGFVSAIQKGLDGAESYHVGVVTTEAYPHNQVGCTDIGDLVTKTGGVASSNSTCGPFGDGRRYMNESDGDLGGKFACAAKVGVSGSDDERVMRAMLNAIDPQNNAKGACNDGFSRLESLLIVVLITDEDDAASIDENCDPNKPPIECQKLGSGGSPDEWYQQLVAFKGGIPENVVVLSLLGKSQFNTCEAVVAKKLVHFTTLFGGNGFTGDICASSYDEFFAQTLPIVDSACAGYVEPK